MSDAHELYRGPCPSCTSSDAFSTYSDGHGHCYSCGFHSHGNTSGERRSPRRSRIMGLIQGEPRYLRKRKLTEESCSRWKYWVGDYKGETVQIANYYDKDGEQVAQKLRRSDKSFCWLGEPKKAMPFGYQLFRQGGKKLVVTEGEIDAISVSQQQDHKWPVVSIGCGAAKEEGLRKVTREIERNIEYFLSFDEVIFMFDSDDPGRASAKAAASILPPGKGKIASLPLKDANELLVAGRGYEIITAIWDAKEYRPDHVVNLQQLGSEIKKPIEWGIDWPWPRMTELTYGRRRGEIHTFGAGPGIGKTDFLMEQIAFTVNKQELPAGVIMLETPVVETGKRLAGKVAGKLFHIPDTEYSMDELDSALHVLGDKVYLYDSFGSSDWNAVKNIIHYYVQGLGIKDIWLDHLTYLRIPGVNGLETLETIMKDLGSMVKQLDFSLYLVSHLSRPGDGRKPYSKGGEVRQEDFYGSSIIEKVTHYQWGLERNVMSEEEDEQNQLKIRVLKDRYTGRAAGHSFFLDYDKETGLMKEAEEELEINNEQERDF